MSVQQPTPVPGRHRLPDGYRPFDGPYPTPAEQTPLPGFLEETGATTDLRDVERTHTAARLGPTLTTVAVPERTATRVELQVLNEARPTDEPHLQAVFRATPTPLLLLSPDSVVRDANPAAEALTGRSARQLNGADAFSLFGDGLRLRAEVEQARRSGTPVLDRETTVVRSDFSQRRVAVSVAAVADPSGHMVAHLVDRGPDREDPDARRHPTTDPVTGLPSRAEYLAHLNEAVVNGHRHDTSTSVLVLQVTGLIRIEEELGRDIADRAAAELAATLRAAVRGADTVARIGVEIFTVVCAATGADEANVIADRICVSTAGTITAHGRTIELNPTVRVFTSDPNVLPAVAFSSLLRETDVAIGLSSTDAPAPSWS